MKVAVTDYTFPDLDIERGILEPAGCEIEARQCKTPETLIALTADAEYVITQFAPLTADVVASMHKTRVIVRYGIGYDNVACDAARAKNIPVCNVPDYCIDEVADHTLAFILSATRCIQENRAHMQRGNWGLGVPLGRMRALRDQTVGIVGLGRIGRAVADRLRAFHCRLLAFDPPLAADRAKAQGCSPVSLEQLLEESDIVTLHCPSNAQTRGIINRDSLAKMKSGTILVNVGRGDLVDLDALVDALRSKHVAAASLDVFDTEPLPAESPLLKMENAVVSSHVASASPRAARRLRETAAKLVLKSINGEPLSNVVNGVTS